jgi:hypothetical protein
VNFNEITYLISDDQTLVNLINVHERPNPFTYELVNFGK